MVCFCKQTAMQLQLALPRFNVSASLAANAQARAALQAAPMTELASLFAWLAKFGLPAAPWQPDPAWLQLPLPKLTLSASAMATLSAFGQLQAMAQLMGLNLMVPAQATAFARLAATLTARLTAMLQASPILLNPAPWSQLSASLTASAQVEAALGLGLFPTPPVMGPPLSLWRGFLSQLRALLPMVALTQQLGLNAQANLSAELATAVRPILAIPMPVLPPVVMSLMMNLIAALAAVAHLKLTLGIDPLEAGLPAVQMMVAARLQATAVLVEQTVGMSLATLLADLLALAPSMLPEYCPTMMAPPAAVHAAINLKVTALTWHVPPIAALPILNIGLPIAALTAQMNAALGLQASLVPCAQGCDAAALLAALKAA
jgi:hypothetical protein